MTTTTFCPLCTVRKLQEAGKPIPKPKIELPPLQTPPGTKIQIQGNGQQQQQMAQGAPPTGPDGNVQLQLPPQLVAAIQANGGQITPQMLPAIAAANGGQLPAPLVAMIQQQQQMAQQQMQLAQANGGSTTQNKAATIESVEDDEK